MLRILLALVMTCAFIPARAADTSTTTLQFLLMEQGAHNNDWGSQTNSNWSRAETALAGVTTKVLGGSNVTLSDDEARSNTLVFTGTLSANVLVTVPARNKSWIVHNNTSGAFTVSLAVPSGTPVLVPGAIPKWYWSSGTSVTDLAPAPNLTTNSLYANTGSGAGVVSFASFLSATSGVPATFSGLTLTAAAGTARTFDINTAATLRWRLGADTTAEAGSNAGSDLALSGYADDGTTLVNSPIRVKRSTGNIGINGAPSSTYKVDVGGTVNATEVYRSGVPIYVPGEIKTFAMNTCPANMLPMDGSAVSRTTYANLFTNIATAWGAGNGTTTFNVPDARGEFLRGWDNGRGVDATRAFASLQAEDLKSHTHSSTAYNSGGIVGAAGAFALAGSTTGNAQTINVSSTGGTETRPRNIAVLYCIAF